MKKAKVTSLGIESELELSWIDGQIGAIPVFEDYDKALKYAKGNTELIEELIVE